MKNSGNRNSSALTAEDIEKIQRGEVKIKPNRVGLQAQGSPNRYHAGYHPPRKTILGSNGSSF